MSLILWHTILTLKKDGFPSYRKQFIYIWLHRAEGGGGGGGGGGEKPLSSSVGLEEHNSEQQNSVYQIFSTW